METLEYLEKILSGLQSRYLAGDKSVENKLRSISAKIDQLKLQKDLIKPSEDKKATLRQQLANTFRKRRGCCR